MKSGRLLKNGSFFCRRAGLCVWGKSKCAICAVGKKLKHRSVGNDCRLTRCSFVVSFLSPCSLDKWFTFSQFLVVCLSFTLAGNIPIREHSNLNFFRVAEVRLILYTESATGIVLGEMIFSKKW